MEGAANGELSSYTVRSAIIAADNLSVLVKPTKRILEYMTCFKVRGNDSSYQNKPQKAILDGITAGMSCRSLTAIMGASGSG